MPTTREILDLLSRDELLGLVDGHGVIVGNRRIKSHLADRLEEKGPPLAELLAGLSRDRLKELCLALGLDDGGREKAVLVARLTAKPSSRAPARPPAGDTSQLALFGDESPAADRLRHSRPPASTPPAVGPVAGGNGAPASPRTSTEKSPPMSKRPPSSTPPPSPRRPKAAETKNGGGDLGFERTLFLAADKLRNNLDAAEYKHVVLGLIFLKYISDAFDELHAKLTAQVDEGADPEHPDEYRAERVFWVPKEARWATLQAKAKQPSIGQFVDAAMVAIERDNPSLKGVLPKNYGRPQLDKHRLGELVDLIGTIGLGSKENQSKDILGRVYEYFLGEFALAEGKKGGQFYTPGSVVRLLVEMLAPYKGRVYDPCCGSGGMFVQSERFIQEHGGRFGDISIFGQESNPTTWRLAKMNLAIRGIEANLGPEHADTFHRDLHPELKADYVLANPPFNDSDWGGERLREDVRWKYGVPPAKSANFAWVQHFIHHLTPNGQAGFVLANGSMSSNQSGEGEIRKAIVEADLVDCMVALPAQLFYSTQIPACLWFLARDKKGGRFRDRRRQVLFIDARKLGRMIDRVQRELTDEDVAQIASTYHAWREDKGAGKYEDVAGFCKSASIEEIRGHQHVLTPGRYVGAEDVEDVDEPFETKFPKLMAKLEAQFLEASKLERVVRRSLGSLLANDK